MSNMIHIHTGVAVQAVPKPETIRSRYRQKALDMLKSRRGLGADEAEWRTITAWTYLQMAMGKASQDWTRTPPRVTIGGAA